MTGKLIFSLQIMLLGLSAVMLVLFALYGLMALFNRIFSRMEKPATPAEEKPVTEELPPRLAAAISAAVSCYREENDISMSSGLPWRKETSRWLSAARRELMEKGEHPEISRRKRT